MSQCFDASGAVVVIFYKPKSLIFLLPQILYVGGIHYSIGYYLVKVQSFKRGNVCSFLKMKAFKIYFLTYLDKEAGENSFLLKVQSRK